MTGPLILRGQRPVLRAACNTDGWSLSARVLILSLDGHTVSELGGIKGVGQTTADRSVQVAFFDAAPWDGYIVDASVSPNVDLERGSCYASISRTSPFGVICQGYVYTENDIALGDKIEQGPTGGHGMFREVDGANPAAGVDTSDLVPTNAMWRVLSARATLVTDGAGTPRPEFVIDNGGGDDSVWRWVSADTQAVSITRDWALYLGGNGQNIGFTNASSENDTERGYQTLPDNLYLPEGLRLRWLRGAGGDAGDDFGPPKYMVEEWVVF